MRAPTAPRRRTLLLALALPAAACDGGASVEGVDLRALEARVTRLEEENTSLRAALDNTLDIKDLEGYATAEQAAACGACLQPGDLDEYLTEDDLPAPPDLSGYATTAALKAVTDGLPDFSTFVTADALAARGYVTDEALTAALAPYLKESVADQRYAPRAAFEALTASLAGYVTADALNQTLAAYLTTTAAAATYAELTDLEPYALDADLDAFDDAVHLIDADVVKTVGPTGDFPTLEAAMAWADHFSVAQGHTLTFQLADGTHTFAGTFSPVHRDGGRIRILGNVGDADTPADPSKVILDFPDGGGLLVRHGRLGLLDGVTLRGKKTATGAAAAHGVHATDGGVILLGANVVVENFAFSGVRATFNGYVQAAGVTARGNGLDGFAALDGGTVWAGDAVADANGRHGFNAAIGGVIDGTGLDATNNGQVGARAFAAGTLYAANGLATGNGGHGALSAHGSHLYFENGVSEDNRGQGVWASLGGSVEALNASASRNFGNGFGAWGGGMIGAQDSDATANRQSGYWAYLGAVIQAPGAASRDNLGSGFQALLGSAMQAGVNNLGQATVAERNAQTGYSAHNGAAMDATAAQAIDNGGNGFGASLGGSIEANHHGASGNAALASGNKQQGFGAWQSGAISASGATAKGNTGDGFHANAGFLTVGWKVGANGQVTGVALAEDNGGSGVGAYNGGNISAPGAIAKGNDGDGFRAHLNSLLMTHQYGVDVRAKAEDNQGAGFSAYLAGVIDAGPAVVTGTGPNGFSASLGSVIQASGSSATGSSGDAYNAWLGSTLQATTASAAEVVAGGGFSANLGSVIEASDASATDIASTAFGANNGSVIQAPRAVARDVGAGFSGWGDAYVDASSGRVEASGQPGFNVSAGSTLNAWSAVAIGSDASCFAASDGATLLADQAMAEGCAQSGFDVGNNSMARTNGASARECGGTGFNVWAGSVMNGADMRSATAAGACFNAGGNSYVWAGDAHASDCGWDGIGLYQGSVLDARSTDPGSDDEDDRVIVRRAASRGLSVGQGSFASTYGLTVEASGANSVDVGALSGLEAMWARLSGSADGFGAAINGNSYVSLDDALIEDHVRGGMYCAGSFCSAQRLAAHDNNGPETIANPWFDFAFNVFWDGWLDVTGAVTSGHDQESPSPRTSFVEDWGPIFDANAPASP